MARTTEHGITFFPFTTISEAQAAMEAGDGVEFDLDSDEWDDVDMNDFARADEEMHGPNPR